MVNNFGCRHSDKLQRFFDIEARGIDFINLYRIKFEFKESHAKNKSRLFFKLPYEQLRNSDYIVFCVNDAEFFIHASDYVVNKYSFDNRYKHCCLRYTTIRKNYLFKCDDLETLKNKIEGWRYN